MLTAQLGVDHHVVGLHKGYMAWSHDHGEQGFW